MRVVHIHQNLTEMHISECLSMRSKNKKEENSPQKKKKFSALEVI
jgi:hypothetical protein